MFRLQFPSLENLSVRITKGTTPSKSMGGFSEYGVNYIKSESVTHSGVIDTSKFQFISEAVHRKLKRSQLAENDILFSMAGVHLGKTAMVKKVHLPANTNQAVCLIRVNPFLAYPQFVFYSLRRAEVKHFALNATSQSAQPNINLKDIGSIQIPLPPLKDQKAIAHILGTLDDKIELNQKMSQTLEEIAKAIFKSWFVDFDPVRAKAEGRPTGLPTEISDLFPDELVGSEIGEIPKGWEVTSLGDVCEQVTKGTTPTSVGGKFSEDGNILFVKVESVSEDGQLLPSKFAKIDEETDSLLKRSQLREGDVLLSIAGTIGRSTIMPKRFLPANTNQALAILRCSGKEDFVLQTLRSDHIQQNFHSKIVQAVQANLSLGEIKATRCVLPPLGVHDQLIDMIKKIREANEIRDQETSILAELRDTLLPKLISGELRIPDAEKFLEGAGI